MPNQLIDLLLTGTTDTLVMVGVSAIIAFLIGLPIALVLVSTSDFGIYPSKKINQPLVWVINITRSVALSDFNGGTDSIYPLDCWNQLRCLSRNCAFDHCRNSILCSNCRGQST